MGSNRLSRKFDELSKKNEHALICYVVAGYPDITTTEDIISSLVVSGADIIEIGIPFSDPIADGSVIQEASHQALLCGITPDKCLRISQNIRSKFPDLPILIMTYSNILLRAGFRNFMRRSKLSGVDGFILPDLAIEESCCYIEQAAKLGLATVFLVSPNTSENRLKAIVNKCSGFVYVVSVYGITGMRESFENYTIDVIKNIKQVAASKIPVAVGFGISNASHIRFMVDAGADAVIIGSAIVKKIKSNANKEKMLLELRSYILNLKNACR
ncbi:MAG TPA: tryptophan synthase subunit alpha [Nitrososphaeraceae archaeon]|jgi:tryptophan synthase alpha chain